MSTTTVRMDDDLKSRVASAAEQAGKTAHSFIVEAITRSVEQAEEDEALNRIADARWSALAATGESVSWESTKAWLEKRVRGERARRPLPRKLER